MLLGVEFQLYGRKQRWRVGEACLSAVWRTPRLLGLRHLLTCPSVAHRMKAILEKRLLFLRPDGCMSAANRLVMASADSSIRGRRLALSRRTRRQCGRPPPFGRVERKEHGHAETSCQYCYRARFRFTSSTKAVSSNAYATRQGCHIICLSTSHRSDTDSDRVDGRIHGTRLWSGSSPICAGHKGADGASDLDPHGQSQHASWLSHRNITAQRQGPGSGRLRRWPHKTPQRARSCMTSPPGRGASPARLARPTIITRRRCYQTARSW